MERTGTDSALATLTRLASAVTTAFAAPLSVTVAPAPMEAGVIVPVITTACAVKFTPLTLALAMVTAWFAGENVNPLFTGVKV